MELEPQVDEGPGKHTERNRRKRAKRAIRKQEMTAPAAEAKEPGSEEAREAAPGTQGSQMTSSASPGPNDRVELGDAPLGPAQDGPLTDVSPPEPPADGAQALQKEEEQVDKEEEKTPRRELRPRNSAGYVVNPPKTPPSGVFRKGGGRQ
jgi:hypothetical protein